MTQPIAFIDPGPNLVQYLSAVGDRLGPDYRPVFFARQVKSRSLLRRLGRERHPRQRAGQASDWPAWLPLDRERLVARLRKDSDRAQVLRNDPAFCWLVRELDSFLAAVQPAALFFWNGSGLAAGIAEQLGRARGIPLLFAENGYLPNTLQLDPEGVNAFSSIGRGMSLESLAIIRYSDHEIAEFERAIDDYRAGKPPARVGPAGGRIRPGLAAYLLQGWYDWRQRERGRPINRLIPRGVPELPERFVFFPLQVRSDSQLTIHSPLYGNRLDAAIRDLAEALREVAPGLRLVVKLHPVDAKRTDYDPLVRALPDVIWAGGGDVRTILERCACVVTVNSTVGIEGMIFGKPVVTLGNNFYVREGLVHPVRERAALGSQLARALSEPPDDASARAYLRYLYFHAFVRASWRDHSPESVGHLARRMVEMIRAA